MFENIDWQKIHDYQPLIVGSMALAGVAFGIIGNGYLQRRAHRREVKHSRATLAAALTGELKACRADITFYCDQLDGQPSEPAIIMRTKAHMEIYESSRPSIGALKPYQIDYVITAYTLIENVVAQDHLDDGIENPRFGVTELDDINIPAWRERLVDAIEAIDEAIVVLAVPSTRWGKKSPTIPSSVETGRAAVPAAPAAQ